ncbi:MAG: glycosyltransferase family 4 protein [Candidatus Aminicenantes bacterium]|nr:glycosyltransferase family 4 protein [Candidatus Aminicenantes bacterium]
MKTKNVLELIDRPFLGGGQINLLSLAEGLDPKLFTVSVCTGEKGPLVDALKRQGIPHFPVFFSKRFRQKTVSDLVSLIQRHRFDVLHTHGGVAGLYGRLAVRRSGLSPVVVHTLHGIHYLHYRNFVLKHLFILQEKYLSRFTDAVIFVCDADRDKGRQWRLVPEDRQVVVKNGLDFSLYESEARKDPDGMLMDRDASNPIVGTIARLHRQKGISYLLKAAAIIRNDFPDLKVRIVGGGPLRSRLERLARSLGLYETVFFLGERKDVPSLLSRFDVFVLPSLWEGLPYSVLEAAALGKPVVATDVDGVRELIRHDETGLLVPPGKTGAMADAVKRLLDDRQYALQLGRNLRDDIRSRFTLDRMVSQVQDLYIRLLERAPPGQV